MQQHQAGDADAHAATVFGLTGRMGFNPYRKFRAKPTDFVLVIAAVAIALALVFWAALG